MFYVIVWACDASRESLTNKLSSVIELTSSAGCYLGDPANCVTLRPTGAGASAWVGLRPVLTRQNDRMVGVLLEYGDNTCQVDPRDALYNRPVFQEEIR